MMIKRMKRKIVFSFLLFALLLIGLGGAMILIQKKQELRKEATVDYTASLMLLPTHISLQPEETFEVSIVLDPGGQEVVAVDAVLNFNPNHLEVVDIIPNFDTNLKTFAPVRENGSFDKERVINQANTEGRLVFGAVTFDWSTETVTDSIRDIVNPLAVITFKGKTPGRSDISFCLLYTSPSP